LLDDLEKLARPLVGEMAEHPGVGWLQGILFLRMAEERGLDRFGALGRLADGEAIESKLAERLREAADRYHVTGLRPGEAGDGTDGPSPLGSAADGPLRDLLSRLYSDARPNELATLPCEALGHLYERSLGKGDPGGARKTHGAFYTPTYLVDYVVERTLGRVLDETGGGEPPQVRVLDPACGSGAFLLGAYRRLLAWQLHRRTERGEKGDVPGLSAGICENAIFGVDVDRTAIEVAKLSLVLACFDGVREGKRTAQHGEALPAVPRLDRNLRAGHSLIDTDWREVRASAPRRRPPREALAPNAIPDPVRPFHWQREFPEIFEEGGFDVVIGNPPYLSFGGRHAVDISGELRRYYAAHYESGGWPTAHSLFLERSVKLLSRRFVSFVVPDQVGHLGGYRSAREIAQREAGLVEVRYWGERVFRGVTTPALTIVLDKEKKDAPTELVDRDGASRLAVFRPGEPWSVSPAAALIERLRRNSFSLGKLVGDCGIRTTSAKEQVVDWPAPAGNVVPVLEGKLIDRYGCRPPRLAVRLDTPRALFVSGAERYRAASFVIRQTASYPIVGPREHALYFRNSLLALFSPSGGIDVHYLVALLNSKLLRFVYMETVREAHQRTFPQVKIKALQSLPLRNVDLARARERRRHDALVELAADAMAAQKVVLAKSETENARSSSLRRFEAIDRRIDDLVYELYELSQDERDAIERSFARAM
jgi:adenine-specific DNA-methyltransferase